MSSNGGNNSGNKPIGSGAAPNNGSNTVSNVAAPNLPQVNVGQTSGKSSPLVSIALPKGAPPKGGITRLTAKGQMVPKSTPPTTPLSSSGLAPSTTTTGANVSAPVSTTPAVISAVSSSSPVPVSASAPSSTTPTTVQERMKVSFTLEPPSKRRKIDHSPKVKEPPTRTPTETMSSTTPMDVDEKERTFPAPEALRMYELKRWLEANELRCTGKLRQILPKIDPSRLNFHDRLLREKILATEYSRSPGVSLQTSQFAIERLEDLKATLVLNIFPSGFSIDNQPQVHGYTRNTKSFIRAIDSTTLTPDIAELLEEIPCQYYDGCLVVEIRDYRTQMQGTYHIPSGGYRPPTIRRILLRPDSQTIISDISQMFSEMEVKNSVDWSYDDFLAVERRILFATQPSLCLDPSVKVFLVSSLLHYNRAKYNFKRPGAAYFGIWNERVMKKNTMLPQLYNPILPALSSGAPQRSSLLRYLLKNPPKDVRIGGMAPLLGAVAPYSRLLHPVTSLPPLNRAFHLPPPLKRALRFQKSPAEEVGKPFLYCEVAPISETSPGYVGLLREGELPDTGSNGERLAFPLGSLESAEHFLLTIIRVCERDGFVMVYDSSVTQISKRPSAPGVPAPSQMAIVTKAAPVPSKMVKRGPGMPTVEQQQQQQQQQQQVALPSTATTAASRVARTPRGPPTGAPPGQALAPGQIGPGTQTVLAPVYRSTRIIPQTASDQTMTPQVAPPPPSAPETPRPRKKK